MIREHRRDTIPETEAILMRLLLDQPKQYFDLKSYSLDWYNLSHWSGTPNCQAATTALITCMTNREPYASNNAHSAPSHFYDWAHKLFAYYHGQGIDLSMFWASAYYLASLSLAERKRIDDEFFSRYDELEPQSGVKIWRAIKRNDRPSFAEIAHELGCSDYLKVPPINEPKLYIACRRLTNDLVAESRQSLARDLMRDVTDMDSKPFLGEAICEVALSDNELLRAISCNFDDYGLAMGRLLCPPLDEMVDWEIKKQLPHFERLSSITNRLFDLVEKMPESFATALLEKGWQHPWIIAHLPQITRCVCEIHPTDSNNQNLYGFFRNYFRSDGIDFKLSHEEMRQPELLSFTQAIRICNDAFMEAAKLLPPSLSIELMSESVPEDSNFQQIFLGRSHTLDGCMSKEALKAEPDLAYQRLGPLVRNGHASAMLVYNYVEALGIEESRRDFESWLCSCDPELGELSIKMIAPLLVKYNLPAGNLLKNHSVILRQTGYQLRPEDCDSAEKIAPFFGRGMHGNSNLLTSIWEKEQWATTLLNSGHSEKLLVRSLIYSLSYGWSKELTESTDSLGKVMRTIESHDELYLELWKIAWDPNIKGDDVRAVWFAQKLLQLHSHKDLPRFGWIDGKMKMVSEPRWNSLESRQELIGRMKQFLKSRQGLGLIAFYPEMANLVMTEDCQRCLFFSGFSTGELFDGNSVGHYKRLFCAYIVFPSRHQSYLQLEDWLESGRLRINPMVWLNWVSASQAHRHNQLIRDRVYELIDHPRLQTDAYQLLSDTPEGILTDDLGFPENQLPIGEPPNLR